jgi:hypothetical protein
VEGVHTVAPHLRTSITKMELTRGDWLCPGCHAVFDHKKHHPLVLNECGHTFCHHCVTGEVLNQMCSMCKSDFNFEKCVPNHILEPILLVVEETEDAAFLELIVPKPKQSSVRICFSCDSKEAVVYCKEDKCFFCCECNDAIHSAGKWKLHSRVDASKAPTMPVECAEHKDEVLKFYCITCSRTVCRDCKDGILGSHADMFWCLCKKP